ncbi:hypothetical protein V1506DRAFT_517340 [Lipomyces tetrasporus]
MARSGLMVKVRRPLSPDAKFEVPAHQEDYERVKQIVDDEGENSADPITGILDSGTIVRAELRFVVGPPTPLHSGMAFELVAQIRDEVKYRLGINTDVTRGISTMTDSEMSRGTQKWTYDKSMGL